MARRSLYGDDLQQSVCFLGLPHKRLARFCHCFRLGLVGTPVGAVSAEYLY